MVDHIKIAAVEPVVQYIGNGTQKEFIYPFAIFSEENLKVSLNAGVQSSGYLVFGVGASAGGSITFNVAPANGIIVRLERRLEISRTTDFLEGGNFAARSVNNELDYLVASIQQVQSDTKPMLRYPSSELLNSATLPERAQRAGRVLGFNGNGDPTMYGLGQALAPTNFTATGAGAATRTMQDKFEEVVSVKDFGAVGNGIADDTVAIQSALASHDVVFIPPGIYRIQSTIEIAFGKRLFGAGNSSIIRAANQTFDTLRIPNGYASIHTLRIENGLTGIKLFGRDGACVQNSICDVSIWDAENGLLLDGYNNTNKPCYWNNFDRILIARPRQNGVLLTKSGNGDTPNANRFHKVRVYSLSQAITGSGIYIQNGQYNNAFIDCECDLHVSATNCVRLGAGSNKTIFVNLYTETNGGAYNIQLDAGSAETAIYNLLSASGGAAIKDFSGGNYTAYNAGYPYKNKLQKTLISDVTAQLLRFDTKYVSEPGAITLNVDLATSYYLISAFNGTATINLPNANDAGGAVITIKKTDVSTNPVIVQETGGSGPDGRTITLSNRYDYITAVCNGANWWIMAHNMNPTNTFYRSTAGLFEPDLTRGVYLVSAFAGAVETRLPPANASNAIGRIVTVKKIDVSGNAVSVTESGGAGPDGGTITLSAKNQAVTIISNGSAYQVLSKLT